MKKVVFIMSMAHSGSSLLSLILGSHPECFAAGELKGLPNRQGKVYLDCVNLNSTFWEETFGEKVLDQLALGLAEKRINKYIPLKFDKQIRSWFKQDLIFNPYSLMFTKLNQNIIVDSSKNPKWIRKRLSAKEFTNHKIDAYVIYLVRDGRSVVNSKLRRSPNRDIEMLSNKWVKELQDRQALFQEFSEDRKIKIAYEELASNPSLIVERICNLLEIKFIPDMLNYWKYDHHDISGNGGTYSLVRRYQGQDITHKVKSVHGDHYQDHDFAIKLDLRWQKELDPSKLAVFNAIAGKENKPYEWN